METKLLLNVLHLPCNSLTHTNFHVQFVTQYLLLLTGTVFFF